MGGSLFARQVESLLAAYKDPIVNMANLSALIYEQWSGLNWAGFYRRQKEGLLLGPFQGKPACVFLPAGKGVCAAAAEQDKSIIVDDVHAFPGHIACDSASRSEMVIPVHMDNRVVAVLDLDSPRPARFTEEDKRVMEAAVRLFEQYTEWRCEL